MFIAKNNNLIILAKGTREELEQALQFMIYTSIEETDINYQFYNGEYLSEEQIAERREEQFNKEFFNTSLGYVKRKVTMKDGTTKDFLTDILPLLQSGIPVLTYSKELEQIKSLVTDEFIEECKKQLMKDFYGENVF